MSFFPKYFPCIYPSFTVYITIHGRIQYFLRGGEAPTYDYRPQTKFPKVVFTPVCQSFCSQGGVCLSACWDTTPLVAGTPLGVDPPEQLPPPPEQGPPWQQPPPPPSGHPHWEQTPPPPGSRDSYCCRWYASYWNAFLFCNVF